MTKERTGTQFQAAPAMSPKARVAAGLLVAACVVWGSTFVVIKDALAWVDPYLIVASRTAMAAAFMLLIAIGAGHGKALRDGRVIARGALLGLLLGLMYLTQTFGLGHTTAGHSGFITALGLVLVPVVLRLLYGRRIPARSWLALGIVTLGLAGLAYDFGEPLNRGDAITLLTALTVAFHIVYAERFVRAGAALPLITHQFLFAALTASAGALAHGSVTFAFPPRYWAALIFLGLLGTLFCYFIAVWALKHVAATAAAIIFTLEPVFAAVFGFMFLGEVLDPMELSGAAFIFGGVLLHEVARARAAG